MCLRHAKSACRNAAAILEVLERLLPRPARVLELGSGTGEQAVLFAARMPWLEWQPSDPDEASRASIAAWTARAGTPNVRPPLDLDLLAPTWRLQRCDALVCVSVLHVAPPEATAALLAGAGAVLPQGGPLVLGGPFRRRSGRGSPFEGSAPAARGEELLPDEGATVLGAARHGLGLEERRVLEDGTLLLVLRKEVNPGLGLRRQ